MEIDLTPTLIDMYRETFEGAIQPDWFWIVSGSPADSVLGTLAEISWEQAYFRPAPERKSIAAHAAHLRFTLELTLRRWSGENPVADWASSFDAGEESPEAWAQLQRDLENKYTALLNAFELQRHRPIAEWLPIHAAVLSAMIGHNAYHLGAIRQLRLDAQNR